MQIKPTHYQDQVKIFEKAGCVYVRTKGDHLIYIAQVLREELELGDESRVEPERILKQWDVDMLEQSLDGCPVDAVTAWGATHGPIIILNTGAGSRAAHSHGLRSTLAHEICVSYLNSRVNFDDINELFFNPLFLLILKIYFSISNNVYYKI